QERGLAATVRAHDPQPLAALELEAQPAEEALIAVSLGQVLDLEDDVAGARDVAEVHPRGLDAGRGLDALDLVQHLLPRLRLLSELPVVDAADVLLLLLDELLLRLVLPQALLVPLLPQPDILLVVARVRRDRSVVQLEDLGHDLVEEVPVVADD